MSTPSLKQVQPLTTNQIDQFKRDGFLVLPAVLDPDLCREARGEMWETVTTHLPRMKRDDPTTWGPITEEESARLKGRPEGGGDPYFSGVGHRFTVRNGAEELLLISYGGTTVPQDKRAIRFKWENNAWQSLGGAVDARAETVSTAVYRQCAVCYTDFWQAYQTVIPSTRHCPVGKETGQTSYIERFNCTIRQRVSRLVRKTLSFSKKVENHIGAIWLFVHHYNAPLLV